MHIVHNPGVSKPRSKKESDAKCPYTFERNGRIGYIKKWAGGKYGTYFRFAGKKVANSFGNFDAAYLYLEREFSRLDTDRANSLALNPLNGDVRNYSELEQLLRTQGDGATLRDAVAFYLTHNKSRKLHPKTVTECIEIFLKHRKQKNITPLQIKTLTKHLHRFEKSFGKHQIHDIPTLDITNWLMDCKDEKTGKPWSVKTRSNVLSSLVSLSLFSQKTLGAILDMGQQNQFQKVDKPRKDRRGRYVDIYTPEEIEVLLNAAIEHDVDLIPIIAIGCFQGLRPFEIHGEDTDRPPLEWEAFRWNDKILYVTGQKIASKKTRQPKFKEVTQAWLEPFRGLTGPIWKYKQAHSKKMIVLRKKAKTRSIYDGFRHSFASYRIRELKGSLDLLAEEMGNSPAEIVNSYKYNVTDEEAEKWFNVFPPAGYAEEIKAVLSLRQAV